MMKFFEGIKNKVNNGMAALYVRAKGSIENEKGVSTIEWVGLAAVVVALMFAVAGAMKDQGANLAGTIVSKISEMLKSINK
jgi:hypothetical protein